jgi:DNA-binding MarR family transcriptional regulator
MTTSEAPAGAADPVGPPPDVRTLSNQLPRFVRLAHAHKAQLAGEGRDRAALVLLFPLERLGPLRQGALADMVHADPSTISRHVTSLVDQGLVRRVADESDGRASRLVITEAGHQAMQDLCTEREARVARATAAWDPDELATFTRLLGRLIDDMEASLTGTAGDRTVPDLTAPQLPPKRRTR